MKMLYGLSGVALLIAFLAPVLFKLRGEYALLVIAFIGIALAATDMFQGVRELRARMSRVPLDPARSRR